MNNQRIRDMALGFALCAALIVSYYCGVETPTSANASPLGSSDYAVVGGTDGDGMLGYVVVDKSTGKVVFSERISQYALGSAADSYITEDERYW